MASMSVADYVVFAAVLVGSSLIGVYYAWKEKKTTSEAKKEEYLTGDKSMGVLPVSLSLVASLVSSLFMLGIPGEIFTHSIQFWLSNIGVVVGIIVCDQWFVPLFYDLQMASVNKYLLKRFNMPSLRIVSSLSFMFSGIFISGTIVFGPALAISSVTPMSINVSIVVVGAVCTFYTAAGGMKAVIWTDVLQLFVMLGGMLMVAIQATKDVGGWNTVWGVAYEGNLVQMGNMNYDEQFGVPTLWECTLGMMVGWAGTFATNQMCVQRYCSLPSLFQAKLSMYISIPFCLLFVAVSCYSGVALFANYFHCDPLLTGKIFSPDQLMPYYVMESLGYIPGVSGLFVAAVFSGSLSTLSSAINSMTLLTWDDFLKRFIHVSATWEIIIVKLIAVVYGVLTTAVAFLAMRMGSVLEVVLLLCGGIVGPQFGIFFLGAMCPYVDGISAMVSFVFGQVVCMVFNVTIMVLGRPMRRLPTYTDQCPGINMTSFTNSSMLDYSFYNETSTSLYQTMANETTFETVPATELYWIHNISPFFMPFLGMFSTILCGLILPIFTGGMDQDKLDPRYISPPFRKFMKKKTKGFKSKYIKATLVQGNGPETSI